MSALSIATFGNSFAEVMEEYCSSLKGTLIDEACFSGLKNQADYFPLSLSEFWCIEIPLNDAEGKADFLFCISNSDLCYHYFFDEWPESGYGKEAALTFLPGILTFSKAWREAKNFSFKTLVNIWFEYDFNNIEKNNLKPNFFYAPAKGAHPFAVAAATETILHTISEEFISKKALLHLLHCCCAVPQGAWVSQIGKMFAREEDSLRLFIQQIPKHGIKNYLNKIGYEPVSNHQLDVLLNDCYQLADQVDLDIDVLNITGDTIGIECSFNETKRVVECLDCFFANGLCTKQKHEALSVYLRKMQASKEGEFCPFFSHFKIVFHPLKPARVKAYLGFANKQSASKIIRTKPSKIIV